MAGGEVRAEIGVIGGSGFYSLFEGAEELIVETGYGVPSGPVTVGEMAGRRVAFLPRHGARHELAPHRVPYRANIAALGSLGVERIFAPTAVGSLRPDVHPGELVVPDQLVDLTSGRHGTFFDGDVVKHMSFADPYCPELRAVAVSAASSAGVVAHDGGTVVTISGPRFSTRAESSWYRSAGWDLVNMTQCPEAALARELGLCYCAIALVTDYDTGGEGAGDEPVTAEAVFAVLRSMVSVTSAVLARAVGAVAATRACPCRESGPA
jgi:5'-methylthioadenosine phosphorylase